MPRDFSLKQYKAALDRPGNKNAKEGWEYLVARGVSETEVFKAVKVAFSSELEDLLRAWKRTRLHPDQVRALGRQLQKHAGTLEKVIVQYPDLLPVWTDVYLPRDPEIIRRNRLEVRFVPAILNGVAGRLIDCRGKESQTGQATVRRRRTAKRPSVPAGLNLLSLFWRAEAGFCEPGFALPLPRSNRETVPLPSSLLTQPARAPYAWAAELLNLACRLARSREVFSADLLRKMQDERAL